MNNRVVYRVWLSLRVCLNAIGDRDPDPNRTKAALIGILKKQEGERGYFRQVKPEEMAQESLRMLPSVFNWIVNTYFKEIGK